jgi:hypothetical protein
MSGKIIAMGALLLVMSLAAATVLASGLGDARNPQDPAAGNGGIVISPPDPPYAAVAAQRQLSELLDLPLEKITLLSFERVEWRDGCLEIAEPGQMCTQVITPGWRVVLEVGGKQYSVHTDLQGERLRMNSPLGQGVEGHVLRPISDLVDSIHN